MRILALALAGTLAWGQPAEGRYDEFLKLPGLLWVDAKAVAQAPGQWTAEQWQGAGWAAAAVMGTTIFVALGALLSKITSLTLIQAIGVTIGSTFVILVVAYVVHRCLEISRQRSEVDDEEDWADDDDEVDAPWLDVGRSPLHEADPSQSILKSARPGRNEPCPCGSGRKFKNCCAKTDLPF